MLAAVQLPCMAANLPIDRWLAQIDDLIIRRELQASRLAHLVARLSEVGVRRPSLKQARNRIARALVRLDEQRAFLVAQL